MTSTTREIHRNEKIPVSVNWSRQVENVKTSGSTLMGLPKLDKLDVVKGGYDRSFKAKMAMKSSGLVTGALTVSANLVDYERGFVSFATANNIGTKYRSFSDDWGMTMGTGNDPGGLRPWSSLEDEAMRNGLRALYKEIHQGRKALGMAFVAEYSKSSAMMRQYASEVGGLFKRAANGLERDLSRYKRGLDRSLIPLPVRAQRLLDFSAEHWTRLNFGLRPLIDDVESLTRAIASLDDMALRGQSVEYRKQGGASDAKVSTPSSPVTIDSFSGLKYLVFRSTDRNLKLKFYCRDVPDMEWAAKEAFGLAPPDVLPTLYELLPFSWAADYVSNTGQVISAFSTRLSFAGDTQITRVKTEKIQDFAVDATVIQAGWKLVYRSFNQGKRNSYNVNVDRWQVDGLPSPPWSFTPDITKFRASMLAAVGWQFLNRKRKAIDGLATWILASG